MSLPLYRPEYCEMLIKHMEKGLSYQTFGGTINAARSTVYGWEEQHPEFREAKQVALMRAQAFFEEKLLAKVSGKKTEGINTKEIDTACLIFALKTRFYETYGEKQDINHTVNEIKIDKNDFEM